jgi:hypothetical protein
VGACGLLTRAPPPRAPPWPWRRRFSEVLVFAGQGSSWHPQERRRVAKRTCCATKLSSPWRTSHRARAIDKPFTCVWHVRWNSKCVMCPFKGEVAGAIFEAKREVRACFGMQHAHLNWSAASVMQPRCSSCRVQVPSSVAHIDPVHGNGHAGGLWRGQGARRV